MWKNIVIFISLSIIGYSEGYKLTIDGYNDYVSNNGFSEFVSESGNSVSNNSYQESSSSVNTVIPLDSCAVILEALSSIKEVKDYVNSEVDNPRNVKVYLSTSDHYGVGIGLLKDYEKNKIMSQWKKSGKIPKRAMCLKNDFFKQEVYVEFSKTSGFFNSNNQSQSRGNQNFNSAINRFKQSGNQSDLKRIYELAKTRSEKLEAEKLLFQNLALSKIFNIKLISSNNSVKKYNNIIKKTIPLMGSVSDISMQIKNLKKKFKLEPKISLIGNYKVKVDFSLEIGTNLKSNLVPSRDSGFLGNIMNQIVEQTVIFDTKKYTVIFHINNSNGHEDIKVVNFKVQSGGTSALGVDAQLNIVSINLETSITNITSID